MFGTMTRNPASAYATIGLETSISSASPHRLISMLYDGALTALSRAVVQMKAGDIAAKGKSLSQAIAIIDTGLRASLDKKGGAGIAESLDSLYEYMSNRLLTANLSNRYDYIEEVHQLLNELKGAWEQIAPQARSTGVNDATNLSGV